LRLPEGLVAVPGHPHILPPLLERDAEAVARVVVVLDEEDAQALRGSAAWLDTDTHGARRSQRKPDLEVRPLAESPAFPPDHPAVLADQLPHDGEAQAEPAARLDALDARAREHVEHPPLGLAGDDHTRGT